MNQDQKDILDAHYRVQALVEKVSDLLLSETKDWSDKPTARMLLWGRVIQYAYINHFGLGLKETQAELERRKANALKEAAHSVASEKDPKV